MNIVHLFNEKPLYLVVFVMKNRIQQNKIKLNYLNQ